MQLAAVVDAEVVAARTVHDQHREHARRRGREPERVPLRLGERFERGEHDARTRRARRPAIAALIATSSTVATPLTGGSTHTHVVGRVRRRREQRLDRVVGRGEQRHAVAPVLFERQLVLRARIGGDLDPLARRASRRHARAARAPAGSTRRRSVAARRSGRASSGYGSTSTSRSPWPTWRATLCACTVNSSHTIATTGFSCSSTATESLIVNVVHDPQVPRPTIAASTCSASSSICLRSLDAGLADLRAGLDRDRLRAVALQVLVPDARDQLPRAPGPVGAQADREAGERPVEPEGRRAHFAGRVRGRAPHPDRVVVVVMRSTASDICVRIQCSLSGCDRAAVPTSRPLVRRATDFYAAPGSRGIGGRRRTGSRMSGSVDTVRPSDRASFAPSSSIAIRRRSCAASPTSLVSSAQVGGDGLYYHAIAGTRGRRQGLHRARGVRQARAGDPDRAAPAGLAARPDRRRVRRPAHDIRATVIACLIGTATVVMVGFAGRRIAGGRVGLVAAAIAAVYPNFWLYERELMSETLTLLLAATTILLAYRFHDRPTRAARSRSASRAARSRSRTRSRRCSSRCCCIPLILLARGTSTQGAHGVGGDGRSRPRFS